MHAEPIRSDQPFLANRPVMRPEKELANSWLFFSFIFLLPEGGALLVYLYQQGSHTMNANEMMDLCRAIANSHKMNPFSVRGNQFELRGSRGAALCWATEEGLIVGGKGLMAGTLAEALNALCFSIA